MRFIPGGSGNLEQDHHRGHVRRADEVQRLGIQVRVERVQVRAPHLRDCLKVVFGTPVVLVTLPADARFRGVQNFRSGHALSSCCFDGGVITLPPHCKSIFSCFAVPPLFCHGCGDAGKGFATFFRNSWVPIAEPFSFCLASPFAAETAITSVFGYLLIHPSR